MNVLISLHRDGIAIQEVPIKTVCIDGNSGSHFDPLLDSARIYFVLARFSFSSIFTAAVDFLFFALAHAIAGNALASLIAGRVVASVVNYVTNRKLVFHDDRKKVLGSLLGYGSLVVFLMFAAYALITLLHDEFGMHVIFAKLVAEASLFMVSFTVQRDYIFRRRAADANVEE